MILQASSGARKYAGELYLPSVPSVLALIRQYGGDIKETYGVPVEEIQRGIQRGVRKINISSGQAQSSSAARSVST